MENQSLELAKAIEKYYHKVERDSKEYCEVDMDGKVWTKYIAVSFLDDFAKFIVVFENVNDNGELKSEKIISDTYNSSYMNYLAEGVEYESNEELLNILVELNEKGLKEDKAYTLILSGHDIDLFHEKIVA